MAVAPFHRTAEADVAVAFENRIKPPQILGSQGIRMQRAAVVGTVSAAIGTGRGRNNKYATNTITIARSDTA